jgi:hypothetical protein
MRNKSDLPELKDPIEVIKVLKSKDYGAETISKRYRDLASKTDINFDATIKFLEGLPNFLDDDVHLKFRKAMARIIQSSKAAEEVGARAKIAELFRHITSRLEEEIDLIQEFSIPLWREIMIATLPSTYELTELARNIPRLFNPTLSLRARISLNKSLEKYFSESREDEFDALVHVCLISIGAQPFIGSLAQSIYFTAAAHDGLKAKDIEWPATLPYSSVNHVHRVKKNSNGSLTDTNSKAEPVRCFVQHRSYPAEYNDLLLFGHGIHACLGKAITEFCWNEIIQFLGGFDAYLRPISIEMEEDHEAFTMPKWARILISTK